jgi:hypothetical protein
VKPKRECTTHLAWLIKVIQGHQQGCRHSNIHSNLSGFAEAQTRFPSQRLSGRAGWVAAIFCTLCVSKQPFFWILVHAGPIIGCSAAADSRNLEFLAVKLTFYQPFLELQNPHKKIVLLTLPPRFGLRCELQMRSSHLVLNLKIELWIA